MTLRLRLVLALVALSTIGLAVFGVATYALYAHTQYDRLDAQLRASAPILEFQVRNDAGIDTGPRPGGDDSGGRGGPHAPQISPAGTYAELRRSDGPVVARHVPSSSETSSVPKL